MEVLSAPARNRYVGCGGEGLPLVIMDLLSAEHRPFAVETYLKNNESSITMQRIFCCHFGLKRHKKVPDHQTIVGWVEQFRTTPSCLKNKSPGHPRTQWTPA
jgi:hypothetical protein